MRFIIVVFALCLAAGMVNAGAWAREKGQLFTASSSNILLSDTSDANLALADGSIVEMYYDPTVYAEYGLTDRLTLGVEYYTTDFDFTHNAIVFARFPLGDTTGNQRFAASIGVGGEYATYSLEPEVMPLFQGGLSWGMGLRNGWVGIDTSATHNQIDEAFLGKADFTWGFNFGDRWTLINQIQTGQGRGKFNYTKYSPTIAFSVTDAMRISLSSVHPLMDDETPASLRFSIWQTN